MHYIIGTNFSVKPDPRRSFLAKETAFNVNMQYNLINIKPQDSALEYTFYGSDDSKVTLKFNTSKDADQFIAKLRNENLPVYNPEIGKLDV